MSWIQKGQSPNHPKKGSSIRVQPIKRPEDVKRIRHLLKDDPRNLLLFVMGVNNGLRGIDLLNLKVGQVRHLLPGEYILIKERKTGKYNNLVINGLAHKVLQNYLKKVNPADGDWLFPNKKNPTKHLSNIALNLLVKQWCKAVGLNHDNYGGHTLRKTWAYIQRTYFNTSMEILMKRLNHTSPAMTMRYADIPDEEIDEVLMNEI